MKQRIVLSLLAACILWTVPTSWAQAEVKPKRPNILFILLDNIGKDWFRCYGSQENVTPNIDRLAQTGVKFRSFYVTPVCSTTRVALLTGRYPFRSGWHTHHDPAIYGGGYFDWNRETSIARVMKNAGYRTYISGKWQINDLFDPAQQDALKVHGFDEHCIFPEGKTEHPAHKKRYWDPYILENGQRLNTDGQYGPEIFTDRLIDFMSRMAKQDDAPFFAYYSAILTHISVGNTPDNKGEQLTAREQFAGMARYADKLVGRMVQSLDELGIRDDTIILLATDNGTDNGVYHGYEHLGGRVSGRLIDVGSTMKPKDDGYYNLSEYNINTPFIVNCPNYIPGNRESDALIDMSDIFPTLVDFADAKLPDDLILDGHSLVPQLLNQADTSPLRNWSFSQYHQVRIVRDQRFKLFSNGPFYDLSEDPLEQHDLQNSLRLSEDETTREAHHRLKDILEKLPPNTKLPWEFRSISARQLEAAKALNK
ncbi:MAG: sulfatase-like hydrolase/transferase [Verrucomicrobia bacterium]|nr:sulfatase-like hydrolase/transferase [Verrucomicrobiota bacterium]MDA1067374.1 sulfatase-like hydrolase/transferase [Verrucomicrobiota bacterium]